MKKIILTLLCAVCVVVANAFPKAFYVKKGDTYTKYNFGVAGDLVFGNNGSTLTVNGYNEVINLNDIDYITFSAPVDNLSLTPSAQKEKMVQIGEELNSMVNINDNADLIKMWYDFFDSSYNYQTGKYRRAYSEYNVPQEYWDVYNEFKALIKAVRSVSEGKVGAVRDVASRAARIYKVEDYLGVYVANQLTETWVRQSQGDVLELRFNSIDGTKTFSVSMKPSTDYCTWAGKVRTMQIPRTMTFSFKSNDKEVASAVIKTEVVQDKSADMTTDVEANGYEVKNTLNIVNDKITDVVKATVNGKQLVDATSVVEGKNLVLFDEMYEDIRDADHHHDKDGNCIDGDPDKLIAHLYRAHTEADVIGKLQVKGKFFDFSKCYNTLSEEADIYEKYEKNGWSIYCEGKIVSSNSDKSEITVSEYEPNIVDKWVSYFNNYSDVAFYYDGKPQLQGYLSWDAVEDIEDYHHYYNSDWDTYAYTIVDGLLIYVSRDYEYQYNDKGERVMVYGPWHYSAYDQDWNRTKIEVDDKDIIRPAIINTVYLEAMPKLTFPDLTSFMFEDFFDEISFKKLIDDFDAIVDTYLTITGQDDEDDDY